MVGYLEMPKAHCNRSALSLSTWVYISTFNARSDVAQSGMPSSARCRSISLCRSLAHKIWCVRGLRSQIHPVEGPSKRGAHTEGGWDYQSSSCVAR